MLLMDWVSAVPETKLGSDSGAAMLVRVSSRAEFTVVSTAATGAATSACKVLPEATGEGESVGVAVGLVLGVAVLVGEVDWLELLLILTRTAIAATKTIIVAGRKNFQLTM